MGNAGESFGTKSLADYPGAHREPTFDELTIEQRIERLRNEVRLLTQMLQQLTGVVYQTKHHMREHRHTDDGVAVLHVGAIDRPVLGGEGRRDPLA